MVTLELWLMFVQAYDLDLAHGDSLEVAHDADGVVHVDGVKTPRGYVPSIEVTVEFKK